MIAPTNFRGINANANTNINTKNTKNTNSAAISPTLRALLCAARAACAFIRDALVCVAKSIVKLFQQSAAAPTAPLAPTPIATASSTATATSSSTTTASPPTASSTSTAHSFTPPRSPTIPTDAAIVPGRRTRSASANEMAHHHAGPTSSI